MLQKGIRGVPAFDIDGDIIVGFDKDALLRKIDFKILRCSKCGKKLKYPKNKGQIIITCPECNSKYKVKS